VLLCSTGTLRAQSGSWSPPGADVTYPRTLLRAPALAGVQASLAESGRRAIFQTLWADVQAAPPTDNTSASGRRARATWAKNAAFVLLLNRQPASPGLAPLPTATHDALAASTRTLLETINTDVEPFATWSGATYDNWQWRSKELIDYLIAYDLLRGAGEPADALAAGQARLQAFAGNLYRQSTTPFMSVSFYSMVKNNHTLMTAAALGTAAVVLNDATSADANQQPARWAGAGLYTIDNVLWRDAQRQSDSTQVAGYAEGPYYCKYALLNCLPYFRAMGNFLPDGRLPYTFGGSTRSIRNPYFDPKYDRLYEWLTAIRLPDGRLPALEDSYVDMGMPELALTGKAQYAKPMYYSKISGTGMTSDLAQLRDVTVDMRAAWLAAAVAPTAPAHPALTVLPGSGNLIFRSGTDSAATYLHVYGRGGTAQSNSGGHNQGDASSFILHAQGQLLALDPGYLSYGRRAEVGAATNHNLVLVDGAGPALGAPGGTNSAPAAIQRTFYTPQLSYGEVTTTYQNASLTRKTLFVRGTYYLLADAVSAAGPHAYTWQLHGYGLEGAASTAATGTFAGNLAGHEGLWQKNGVKLLAHVAGTGTAATYSTATTPHETTYNTAENHTTLLVQQSGAAQTQFLSALYPYATQPPQVATTSQATTAALATTADGFVDIAFAQADTVLTADASSRLPQPVQADGMLNFYSADANGDFTQLFVQAGTTLQVGPAPVLASSRRADVSWQRLGPGRYAGYASRATTLTLALGNAPTAVRGAGVASYAYDAGQQQLQVVLRQASDFTVTLLTAAAAAPLPVVLTDFAGQRQGPAVALSWHTASEQHNVGFEVQRRPAAAADFTTFGFVAGADVASHSTGYYFRDAAAPAGLAYYRLRQLDRDGTATYSPVVAVAGTAPAAAQTTLLPVFPQPARGWLRVQVAGSADQPVMLRLLDGLGRVVRQQACHSETQLDVSGLPAGLYYLVADGVAGRQKVVFQP
jgi:hypothetical protein